MRKLAMILAMVVATAPAWSQNREVAKEILRLQYTEFCATVKKPPQVIAEALNNAMAQDPKMWMPAIIWWNAIVAKYQEAGCGDA